MLKRFNYQENAIHFLRENKKVYFAMGLGTGKTLTSLWGATEVSEKNVLVVAELNEIENSKNFEKEVTNNIVGWNYVSLREDPQILECEFKQNVCGINPDMLSKLPLGRLLHLFDVIIVDEATLAKTTTTARFQAIYNVAKAMSYVILLSGTPMMNGASEIYAPLKLIDHKLAGVGAKGSQQAYDSIFAGGFRKRIRNSGNIYNDFIWWNGGTYNVRELRYLIKDNFFFVRKEDLKGIFKYKKRIVKYVRMSTDWLTEYHNAWTEYMGTLSDRFGDLTEKQMAKKIDNIKELQRLIENSKIAQINSKWKARQAIEDIKNGDYGDSRIILFCSFVETYDLLCELCKENDIMFKTFDEVNDFKKGNEKVLIGRIKAHGKGGNIPEASVTLFVDMDYVCSNNLQAENRMDRPEQTKEMLVVYYQTEDERVDARIREINKEKTKHIEEFMQPFYAEELAVINSKLSDLRTKHYKHFNILGM